MMLVRITPDTWMVLARNVVEARKNTKKLWLDRLSCYLAAFICFERNDVKIGWKRPRDDPMRLRSVITRRDFIFAG